MGDEKRRVSDGDFEKQMRGARARSRLALEDEPRAMSARFDAAQDSIVVQLTNGCSFIFPSDLVEGLRGADPASLSEVEVDAAGFGLHWEKLDVDYTVGGLMRGIFGTGRWMREMGRIGGSATSEAKAQASRHNGLKGGRPRKARG